MKIEPRFEGPEGSPARPRNMRHVVVDVRVCWMSSVFAGYIYVQGAVSRFCRVWGLWKSAYYET